MKEKRIFRIDYMLKIDDVVGIHEILIIKDPETQQDS